MRHHSTLGRLPALCVSLAAFLSAGCSDGGGALLRPKGLPPASVDGPRVLVTGLEGASGSALGPDGALYVTEGAVGRISRIDPQTGEKTTFVSGLPPSIMGTGGVVDVAFIGPTAYALVTLVDDPLFPTGQVNGIYRIDGPDSFTPIADIGAFNVAHPPTGFDYSLATGTLCTLKTYEDGFLVTDEHLNRVLRVTGDGQISVFRSFGDVVPTGLAVSGDTIYMAEAGPVPHEPETGKVVGFGANSGPVTQVAAGTRLLVDLKFGPNRILFALSQGIFGGGDPGSPAVPNSGSLVKVDEDGDGTFIELVGGLNQPTSMEIVENTTYVVTLGGEVWVVKDIARSPFGQEH